METFSSEAASYKPVILQLYCGCSQLNLMKYFRTAVLSFENLYNYIDISASLYLFLSVCDMFENMFGHFTALCTKH